ncbi:MAG: hypothetical protein KBF88_09760 [Polyangiaceae bacterium]|nr:hypothetical protein [Polyangiaceae bacterium]
MERSPLFSALVVGGIALTGGGLAHCGEVAPSVDASLDTKADDGDILGDASSDTASSDTAVSDAPSDTLPDVCPPGTERAGLPPPCAFIL